MVAAVIAMRSSPTACVRRMLSELQRQAAAESDADAREHAHRAAENAMASLIAQRWRDVGRYSAAAAAYTRCASRWRHTHDELTELLAQWSTGTRA